MTRWKQLAALLTMVVAMGGTGPSAQAQPAERLESRRVVEPTPAPELRLTGPAHDARAGLQREWTFVAARR